MGMHVLISEIDYILADVSVREAAARDYTAQNGGGLRYDDKAYKKIYYSQDAFFNPAHVKLDKMKQDAPFFWRLQEYVDYTVILTGRPHWLHAATVAWLEEHALWDSRHMSVVCKNYDSKVRYLTTQEWYIVWLREAKDVFADITFLHPVMPVRMDAADLLPHSIVGNDILESLDLLKAKRNGVRRSLLKEFGVAAKNVNNRVKIFPDDRVIANK